MEAEQVALVRVAVDEAVAHQLHRQAAHLSRARVRGRVRVGARVRVGVGGKGQGWQQLHREAAYRRACELLPCARLELPRRRAWLGLG